MSFQGRWHYLRASLAATILSFACLPPHVAAQQTAPSDAKPARLLFSIVDKERRALTTLSKEDISLSEDGKPQAILSLEPQSDRPLSLAILIDTSVSQARVLPGAKVAARAFVERVMRPGRDQVSVITFTGTATLWTPLTANLEKVQQAIEEIKFTPPGIYISGGVTVTNPSKVDRDLMLAGATAIWDAVWATSEEVLDAATTGTTRRAMVLITDGADTISQKKMNEAIERAIRAEAVVFTIGIGDEYFAGVNEESLRRVSERTGGRFFEPKKFSDLPSVFADIEQQLRSQYSLTYLPTNTKSKDSLRKIRIEIANPELRKQKLRLSHPQGYFPE